MVLNEVMALTDLNHTYGILMSLWNVFKVFFYQNLRFDHGMERFVSRAMVFDLIS